MLPARGTIINALAGSNQTSSVILADHIVNMSVQSIVTGPNTGTVQIQVSNDPPGIADANGLPTITNWTNLTAATVAIAGPGSFLISTFEVSYAWIRAIYTATNAAAGTITVQFKSNGF